jgi:hypothetical protein
MTKLFAAILVTVTFWAGTATAGEKADGTSGQKKQETSAPVQNAPAVEAKDPKPFVDRDGDGIRDGQEHRFRKRKHGNQDQEGEDDTGTGSGKRKRTMQGQTQGGGQGRQGR